MIETISAAMIQVDKEILTIASSVIMKIQAMTIAPQTAIRTSWALRLAGLGSLASSKKFG